MILYFITESLFYRLFFTLSLIILHKSGNSEKLPNACFGLKMTTERSTHDELISMGSRFADLYHEIAELD